MLVSIGYFSVSVDISVNALTTCLTVNMLKNLNMQIAIMIVICDPFCRNETLLCKTPNGDMAENTFAGDICQF